jgi:hypothetical protein
MRPKSWQKGDEKSLSNFADYKVKIKRKENWNNTSLKWVDTWQKKCKTKIANILCLASFAFPVI